MTAKEAYAASLEYLDGLYKLPLIPARVAGLDRIAFLLHQLDDPHRLFRSVHVAGSTGKGSTTTMVANVFSQAGFRTGRFVSPHLNSITERIVVNDRQIEPSEWVEHWRRIFPIVDAMIHRPARGYVLGRPTYFEVLFAVMSLHFRDAGVQWAAVETGLGGRYDPTNILSSDVAVVTNVSLEHTRILGNSTQEIATEKAAIVKPGDRAVTAAEDSDALHVIRRRAAEVRVPLTEVPRDVWAEKHEEDIWGQTITMHTPASEARIRLPLAGRHQRVNAATAFAAALAAREAGAQFSGEEIVVALEKSRIPGRLEVVSTDPFVILDAAHSVAGARELKCVLSTVLRQKSVVLLFAAMSDKDIVSMAALLGPLASRAYVTEAPGAQRAATVDSLSAVFSTYCDTVIPVHRSDTALNVSMRSLHESECLVVCGSMYLVGFVRHAFASVPVSG